MDDRARKLIWAEREKTGIGKTAQQEEDEFAAAISAYGDEVKKEMLEEIRECDKCDLCEDHHGR